MSFSTAASVQEAIDKIVRNLWTIAKSVKSVSRVPVSDAVENFRVAVYEGAGVLANGSVAVEDLGLGDGKQRIRESLQAWNAALRQLKIQIPTGEFSTNPSIFQSTYIRTTQGMLYAVRRGIGNTGGTIPAGVIAAYNAHLAS